MDCALTEVMLLKGCTSSDMYETFIYETLEHNCRKRKIKHFQFPTFYCTSNFLKCPILTPSNGLCLYRSDAS